MEDNYGIYKYTGPATYLSPSEGGYGMILLVHDDKVKAEVNINVATIKGVYDKYSKEYGKVKEFYVAAKYLEPVKPETIDFTKDDADKKSAQCVVDMIMDDTDKLFEEMSKINHAHKIPFAYIKIPQPWSDTAKEIDKYEKAFTDYALHNKQWAEKLGQPSDETLDSIRKASRKHGDAHEVGGNHYKMAIEPWDYIYANKLGFDEGSVVKYISRHKNKNGAEDVKKVISFCKHILKTQYNEEV